MKISYWLNFNYFALLIKVNDQIELPIRNQLIMMIFKIIYNSNDFYTFWILK